MPPFPPPEMAACSLPDGISATLQSQRLTHPERHALPSLHRSAASQVSIPLSHSTLSQNLRNYLRLFAPLAALISFSPLASDYFT
jgi:hypothetical protein